MKEKYYNNVVTAVMSLLMWGSLPDYAALYYETAQMSPICGLILFLFIVLAPLTLMGMLVGVLVEVVGVVSAVEKEEMIVGYVTDELRGLLKEVDEDATGSISREEFQALVLRKDASRLMVNVGVDVMALFEFCEFLFMDEEEITTFELIELVLQLRGSNHATVKDIVDLRRFVHHDVLRSIDKLQHEIHNILKRVDQRLTSLIKHIPDKLNKVMVQEFQKLGTLVTASVVCSTGVARQTIFSEKHVLEVEKENSEVYMMKDETGIAPTQKLASEVQTGNSEVSEHHMMNDGCSIAPMAVVAPSLGPPTSGTDLNGQPFYLTTYRTSQAVPTEMSQQPYSNNLESLWSRLKPATA